MDAFLVGILLGKNKKIGAAIAQRLHSSSKTFNLGDLKVKLSSFTIS
jgi:hypothetical protein